MTAFRRVSQATTDDLHLCSVISLNKSLLSPSNFRSNHSAGSLIVYGSLSPHEVATNTSSQPNAQEHYDWTQTLSYHFSYAFTSATASTQISFTLQTTLIWRPVFTTRGMCIYPPREFCHGRNYWWFQKGLVQLQSRAFYTSPHHSSRKSDSSFHFPSAP